MQLFLMIMSCDKFKPANIISWCKIRYKIRYKTKYKNYPIKQVTQLKSRAEMKKCYEKIFRASAAQKSTPIIFVVEVLKTVKNAKYR